MAMAKAMAMAMTMALLLEAVSERRSPITTAKKVDLKRWIPKNIFFFFRFFEKFWLGGAAPQTPRFLAGGAKPPQTPP